MREIAEAAIETYRILVPEYVKHTKGVYAREYDPDRGFPYDDLDAMLAKFVDSDGLVDYKGLKKDRALLDASLALMATYSPELQPQMFATESDRLAYWINAHNLFVIAGVVKHYPTESAYDIRPDGAFFSAVKFTAGTKYYSINQIEMQIIRKQFCEPRALFALNKGAIGFPKLPQHIFHCQSLDAEIDEQLRSFINGDQAFRFLPKRKTLLLSALFKWREKELIAWMHERHAIPEPSIFDFLKHYASDDLKDRLSQPFAQVHHFPPDWTLNDQKMKEKKH